MGSNRWMGLAGCALAVTTAVADDLVLTEDTTVDVPATSAC